MTTFSSDQQKQLVDLFRDKVATLPEALHVAEVCILADAFSDQSGMFKPAASGEPTPFLSLMHTGASQDTLSMEDTSRLLSFQLTANESDWSLFAGVHGENSEGTFLAGASNGFVIPYESYPDVTPAHIAEEMFRALTSFLSGRLAVLESLQGEAIYATELLIDTTAHDALWFATKDVPAEGISSKVRRNTYALPTPAELPHIPEGLHTITRDAHDTPLTQETYEALYGRLEKHPLRKLGIIIGLVALEILIVSIGRMLPEGQLENTLLIVAGVVFLIMVTLLGVWFPQLLVLFLLGWIAPIVIAFITGAAFIMLGGLIYPMIPWLDNAINGDNTALSMAIVLPWIGIGIALGITAWVKSADAILSRLGRSKKA